MSRSVPVMVPGRVSSDPSDVAVTTTKGRQSRENQRTIVRTGPARCRGDGTARPNRLAIDVVKESMITGSSDGETHADTAFGPMSVLSGLLNELYSVSLPPTVR